MEFDAALWTEVKRSSCLNALQRKKKSWRCTWKGCAVRSASWWRRRYRLESSSILLHSSLCNAFLDRYTCRSVLGSPATAASHSWPPASHNDEQGSLTIVEFEVVFTSRMPSFSQLFVPTRRFGNVNCKMNSTFLTQRRPGRVGGNLFTREWRILEVCY